MQTAAYANHFQAQNFAGRSHHSQFSNHHWSRLHAAAVDRSLVERATTIDIAAAKQATKRTFDFVFGLILILGLSPALLLIA
jgi:lipopolysaccharide/colanic/teichoic acid biosynthesis glycosyltransferase